MGNPNIHPSVPCETNSSTYCEDREDFASRRDLGHSRTPLHSLLLADLHTAFAAASHPCVRFPAAALQNCGNGSGGSSQRYAAAHPATSDGQGNPTPTRGAVPASGAASSLGIFFQYPAVGARAESAAAACESLPAVRHPFYCAGAEYKSPAPANPPVPSSASPPHADESPRKASSPPPPRSCRPDNPAQSAANRLSPAASESAPAVPPPAGLLPSLRDSHRTNPASPLCRTLRSGLGVPSAAAGAYQKPAQYTAHTPAA